MNEYEIASIVGGAIAIGWILAYVFCWIGQRVWAWVDDSEAEKVSPLICWIAKSLGYLRVKKDWDSDFIWKTKGQSDSGSTWGFTPFIKMLLLTSFMPIALILSIKIYPVAISLLIAAVIAWVARFSRRHKKLFDKHIVDKEAHK